jgi:hypothetical protein
MNRKTERGLRRGWAPVRKARHSSSGLANAGMPKVHYATRFGWHPFPEVLPAPELTHGQTVRTRTANLGLALPSMP